LGRGKIREGSSETMGSKPWGVTRTGALRE